MGLHDATSWGCWETCDATVNPLIFLVNRLRDSEPALGPSVTLQKRHRALFVLLPFSLYINVIILTSREKFHICHIGAANHGLKTPLQAAKQGAALPF